MCETAPISMGSKICDTCRKKLSKTIVGRHVESDLKTEIAYVDSPEALSALNQCLVEIGETPHIKRKNH